MATAVITASLEGAEAMHEVDHIHKCVGTGTARYTPDRRFFKVSKTTRSAGDPPICGQPQGFEYPTARLGEQPTQCPHLAWRFFGRGQEGGALRGGQIFAVSSGIIQPDSIRCRVGITPPEAMVGASPCMGLCRVPCTLLPTQVHSPMPSPAPAGAGVFGLGSARPCEAEPS